MYFPLANTGSQCRDVTRNLYGYDKCMKRIIHTVIGNGHRARTRYEFDIEKHLALQLIENRQIIEFRASVTQKTRRLISDISLENVRIYLEIHASTLQSCSLQNALNFISGIGMMPKLF